MAIKRVNELSAISLQAGGAHVQLTLALTEKGEVLTSSYHRFVVPNVDAADGIIEGVMSQLTSQGWPRLNDKAIRNIKAAIASQEE